MFIPI